MSDLEVLAERDILRGQVERLTVERDRLQYSRRQAEDLIAELRDEAEIDGKVIRSADALALKLRDERDGLAVAMAALLADVDHSDKGFPNSAEIRFAVRDAARAALAKAVKPRPPAAYDCARDPDTGCVEGAHGANCPRTP